MTAIMQKALTVDESKINRERERFNKLIIENKVKSSKKLQSNFNVHKIKINISIFQGLREMLEISKKYGSCGQRINADDKYVQTDDDTEQA